jgi:Tol biopolymer transport system component
MRIQLFRRAASTTIAVLMLAPVLAYAQAVQEPDIGQKTQVTSDETFETMPTWTRDGKHIIFVSDRFGTPGICRAGRTGGGGIAALTQPAADEIDIDPDAGPNGQVVFASNRSRGVFQVWSISIGTRGLTQLTNAANGAQFPAWSPSGSEIAYVAPDKNGNEYIWIMDADGANQRQLTAGTRPRWSPDGKRLVFSKMTQGKVKNSDIYTIEVESSTLSQLTSETTAETFPDWSPDGNWISYISYKGQIKTSKTGKEVMNDLKSKPNYEIWIKQVDAGGKSGIQLTRSKGYDGFPRWAPSGNELAFVSDRGGSLDVWTLVPGMVAKAQKASSEATPVPPTETEK